jgi:hypothetical protein
MVRFHRQAALSKKPWPFFQPFSFPATITMRTRTVPLLRNLMLTLLVCALAACGMSPAERAKKQALRFSNTQTWDPKFLQWAKTAPAVPGVLLPLPPENLSRRTEAELQTLHGYLQMRTPERLRQIRSEIDILGARFGDKTFAEHFDEQRRPNSFFLMAFVIQIESPQVMKQKLRFDRVRPSYLDPTLTTAIPIPPHPAYPSGHATHAYLRAQLLSRLDPKNAAVYMASAARIARNREIAGLHYPSDSEAGRLLAEQLFAALVRDPAFVAQFRKAKREW